MPRTFIFFLTRGFISHYKRCIHALTEVMPGFPALRNPHGFMIYSFFPLMQLCLSPSSFQIVPLHKDKIKSWLIMREISLLTLQGDSNFWFPKGASISEFESHHTSKGPPERQQHSPSRVFNSPWISWLQESTRGSLSSWENRNFGVENFLETGHQHPYFKNLGFFPRIP